MNDSFLEYETEELFDANVSGFIVNILGPSHINFATLIPLTCIYSILFIIGISGNLCTCLVILGNEYMRNATNVYLLNLAIGDIAILAISKYV